MDQKGRMTGLTGTHILEGLDSAVEVAYDQWGIPHIHADSAADVFLAQGFVVAQDRLFPMELWRRRGLGLLSEVLGEAYVEQDRACRLFLYRGDMNAEWNAYGGDTRQAVERFVAGINAYVRLTREQPHLLSQEFRQAGFTPGEWHADDVARIRTSGLFTNLEQEVTRTHILRTWGTEVEDLRALREPYAPCAVPEGLDLDALPEDVLDVYKLAFSPVRFGPAAGRPRARLLDEGESIDGSNNWVVGPGRSASGRPHLANDPHRAITLPSLRYLTHLRCPEFDVIGSGEATLPGITVGHNGSVAFGMTYLPIDQEDLYVCQLHGEDPERYWYRGEWRAFELITETVPVKGSAPQTVTLRYSVHGPVIHCDERAGTAAAVRAAYAEPGTAPYLASVQAMRARGASQFRRALARWGAPGGNHIYADAEGNFSWQSAGLTPKRPNWDGSLPVPGDGRFEWDGFLDAEELPAQHNPEAGWFASANQFNADQGENTIEAHLSRDWFPPHRQERIAEILATSRDWTVDDSLALQNDTLSVPARKILDLLCSSFDMQHLPIGQAEALSFLLAWDARLEKDSPQATLYERWFSQTLRASLMTWHLEQTYGEDAASAAEIICPVESLARDARPILKILTTAVEDPRGRQIVLETLRRSYDQLTKELGPPSETWNWGNQHTVTFRHPLAGLVEPPAWATLPPISRSGNPDTPGVSLYNSEGDQTWGASFRIVIPVGEWDRVRAINAPGQSSDPRSRHYSDLFPIWGDQQTIPLHYTPSAVENNTAHVLELKPTGENRV